ncbi:MAG: hypothetical protein Q8O86_00200 [Dehalococcoidia bacterium]|nr:hypothetical protein [Dehalococcoidia bacterium]
MGACLRKPAGAQGNALSFLPRFLKLAPALCPEVWSEETTMPEDVSDEGVLLGKTRELAAGVGIRLKEQGLMGRTVSIKLRLADFRTFTRQTTLRTPTNDESDIAGVAESLLKRDLGPGKEFRLVGVGVSNLADSFQLPLFPLEEEKWAASGVHVSA